MQFLLDDDFVSSTYVACPSDDNVRLSSWSVEISQPACK